MSVLHTPYAKVLTAVLVFQGCVYYAAAFRSELTPPVSPLYQFPQNFGGYRMVDDAPIDKEVQSVLRADDTLTRRYLTPDGTQDLYFFIAFFKTQRYGQAPHSPKNCLPGAGWEAIEDRKLAIAIPDRKTPIVANEYIVARGSDKSVTLYWYQSHDRVIASEYWAKFWLVADAVRYRRSDTSIVKVIVPVRPDGVDAAIGTGVRFVQTVFPLLRKQLPD